MENFEIKNHKISNSFYNMALDLVASKNLFEAARYLKKSLLFYKENIDSRNLLGLIYFREGELVDALAEWVISINIDKSAGNIAKTYIKETQGDETYMKSAIDAIKNFNTAIDDISMERRDLAMMHLYKATELNPFYVRAYILLSLLQLNIKEHIKAGANLLKAREIDIGNPLLNSLWDETLKRTKKKEVKEKVIKNVYSAKKISEDDVILPNKVIRLSTNEKIVFILVGLLMGVLSYHTIITPMIRKMTNDKLSEQIMSFADKMNNQNKELRDLRMGYEKYKNDYEEASSKLKNYEDETNNFRTQYESLNEIIRLYDAGEIAKATKLYVDLDRDNIRDDTLLALLNTARNKIEGMGAKKLCELGTDMWNAGNTDEAISYYKLSLALSPDDPETMFMLARLYQRLNRLDDANPLFDKIIAEHPTSKYAKRARESRNY